jgi:hypothetical protein
VLEVNNSFERIMEKFMKQLMKVFSLAAMTTVGAVGVGNAQVEGLTGIVSGLGLGGSAGGMDLGGMLDMGGSGGFGGLGELPIVGPVLELLVDGEFVQELMPAPPIDRFSEGGALFEGLVLGAITEPQAVLETVQDLGINAGFAAVPVFQVLMENPETLFDYVMNGGTILFPAAGSTGGSQGSVLPGIPLLTDPLQL